MTIKSRYIGLMCQHYGSKWHLQQYSRSCPMLEKIQFLMTPKGPEPSQTLNTCFVSVIGYLRKGNNCCATANGRGMRKCVNKKSPADSKVSEERGQEMLQTQSTVFPAAHGEVPAGAGCCPAPMGPTEEQIYTLQLEEETTVEQVAWRKLQPMESPCQSRLQAKRAACGEEPMKKKVKRSELLPVVDTQSSLSLTDGSHGTDPHWSSS